jgi:predicted nucleic acid-binding protein
MEPATAENQSKSVTRMSFLLDTDICSAYLKNEPLVVGRVMLHYGGLHISVITVGELLTWGAAGQRSAGPAEGRSGLAQRSNTSGSYFADSREIRRGPGRITRSRDYRGRNGPAQWSKRARVRLDNGDT